MTDAWFDLSNNGSVVTHPVTKAGLIPANARLAGDHIEDRLLHGAHHTLWPNANMDRQRFGALPDEVALSPIRGSPASHGDGLYPVFSVLNGLGCAGETWLEIVESHAFGGLVGSQGAKFGDGASSVVSPDVAMQLGGLSTIVNTGTETIFNGDRLYWDIPKPGEVPSYTTDNSGRIRVAVRPYRPSEQRVTAAAILHRLVTGGRARAADRGDIAKNETPIADATVAITRFVRTMAVMSLDMFLASGLVAFDPIAIGVDGVAAARRAQNAKRWMQEPEGKREDVMVRVARALRVPDVRDPHGIAAIHVQHAGNSALHTYLGALFACEKSLVAPVEGSNNVPSGDKGALFCAQRSALEELLAGVTKANEFVTRRIFATAISVMQPGHAGDVNIGSYAAGF
jgi:hypothetical protein